MRRKKNISFKQSIISDIYYRARYQSEFKRLHVVIILKNSSSIACSHATIEKNQQFLYVTIPKYRKQIQQKNIAGIFFFIADSWRNVYTFKMMLIIAEHTQIYDTMRPKTAEFPIRVCECFFGFIHLTMAKKRGL